jgi:hypothetical protein
MTSPQSKPELLRTGYRKGKMTTYEYFRESTVDIEEFDELVDWFVRELINLADLHTYFGESAKNVELRLEWTELLKTIVVECAP